MKFFYLLLFICTGVLMNAQQRIRFEYDIAGNQIQRTWCITCSARVNDNTKEVSKLEESDLVKFFPEDIIKYYPNPVKEELYLRWELVNNNNVTSIDIYTLNGNLLKSFNQELSQNSLVVSFINYPVGVYLLKLNYNNGEQKSIKIVKN